MQNEIKNAQCKITIDNIQCSNKIRSVSGKYAGICKMHAERIRKNGEVGPIGTFLGRPKLSNIGKGCKAEGCPNLADQNLMCNKHNLRVKRTGYTASKRFEIDNYEGKMCSYDDCLKSAAKNRNLLCEKHYFITDIRRYSRLIKDCKKETGEKNGYGWTIEKYKEIFYSNDGLCYYCNGNFCGVLTNSTGAGLDRIDNLKGHSPDNVIPCGAFCNLFRRDFVSVAEMKDAIDGIIAGKIKRGEPLELKSDKSLINKKLKATNDLQRIKNSKDESSVINENINTGEMNNG